MIRPDLYITCNAQIAPCVHCKGGLVVQAWHIEQKHVVVVCLACEKDNLPVEQSA